MKFFNPKKIQTLPPKYLAVNNELFLLYLKGIRGFFEHKSINFIDLAYFLYAILIIYRPKHRYNIFNYGLLFAGTIYLYYHIIEETRHEFEKRDKPNILIPRFIYRSRRNHYVYWELSRIARGKSSTFSYYDWDPETGMIYFTDKYGKQRFEKFSISRERIDIVDNPLFESVFRAKELTPDLVEKGNKLIAYHQNINNPLDLDNYLHYKPINACDLIRAIFENFMVIFGIANTYKYDQMIPKDNMIYDFEKLRIGMNLPDHNPNDLSLRFIKVFKYYSQKLSEWLTSEAQ